MRVPSAADLIDLRERGAALHAIDRALLVLDADGDQRDALARLPLGVRDARLLAVRRALLGDRIDAEADCPACGERLEFALGCGALIAAASPPPEAWEIECGDWRVTLRPLDSLDAAAAAACDDARVAEDLLLRRCVTDARLDDDCSDALALPNDARDAIARSLADHDPGAECLLDLDCPACRHRWRSMLDVADFVCRELAARGDRLLGEVHVLARAYGWREADILALPPVRRAAYLALVSA
jgi:hypothetical protein